MEASDCFYSCNENDMARKAETKAIQESFNVPLVDPKKDII